MTVSNPGFYYELCASWVAYQVIYGSGAPSVPYLWVKVTVHSTTDISFLPLFFEPFKGNINNIQGFYASGSGGSKQAWSYNNGTGITPSIGTSTNWTVDHEFGIQHYKDQSQCNFLIDGAVVKTNSSPYISAQPFEIESAEVDGVAGTLYEKFPPGIKLP